VLVRIKLSVEDGGILLIRWRNKKRHVLKKKLLALLLLLHMVPAITLAESVVEVINVYNRPASEIQPLLLDLLEYTDQIVANGDSLIVKTTPERLQTITKLIHKLDKPLNNLLITVLQSRDVTAEQLNAETGFEFYAPLHGSSDAKRYVDGNPNQFEGRVYHRNAQINSTNNQRNTQTIRTLEGTTAHIQTGKAYPVSDYQTYPGGYGYPIVTQSTRYIEATTGFAVTPRLVGRQVVLDVSPWSDKLNGQGQLQTQNAQTTIQVNLGEWVDLGGVDESGQSSGNSPFVYNRQSSLNNLHILVKVDVVN
jgi:Bacterial type II and III secretion system protein